MKTLAESDVQQILGNVRPGSVVFLSYIAGRPPTAKAVVEAERTVKKDGIARRHVLGNLTEVFSSKKGDLCVRVFADTRDTLKKDGTLIRGGYRTYNVNLGKLLHLAVISEQAANVQE